MHFTEEGMKTLGGAIFCYNAVKHDYCIVESILNLKEFCDTVSVVDAGSSDGTIDLIMPLADEKCKITIISEWEQHHGREKLSYFANRAMDLLDTDYLFHGQADEIISEDSFPWIRKAMEEGMPGYMCRRYNLWKDPYHMLNVEQNRKPCSTEIVRLAQNKYRAVGDAESLGCDQVYIDYLDKIEIFHVGFVRKREVMKSKIIHMQKDVFEMAGYDQKLDLHEVFEPLDYFSEDDLVPIHKPLPKVIQQWAKERMP